MCIRDRFIDYLELVKANPDIAQLSHKRLYERIMSEGAVSYTHLRNF